MDRLQPIARYGSCCDQLEGASRRTCSVCLGLTIGGGPCADEMKAELRGTKKADGMLLLYVPLNCRLLVQAQFRPLES